ncbi:nuclear factor Y, subunit B1 [Trifolium repens]|nr:nuclear factor Y, subunit B1 [Trifolium repens]
MKRKYPFFHNGQKPSSSSGSSMLHQGAYANTRAPTTLMNPRNDAIVPKLVMRKKITLPFKNVTQIMRKALPPKAKISNGAKKMVQICSSKFINWITEKANEYCKSESKMTLGGDDILWAMNSLDFNNYFESLNIYLERYRYCKEIGPMHLAGEMHMPTIPTFEISDPTLPPPPLIGVGSKSSVNPNPIFEMVEAIDMDKFWAEVDNLDVGSSGTASTNFDPSTEVNFDGI